MVAKASAVQRPSSQPAHPGGSNSARFTAKSMYMPVRSERQSWEYQYQPVRHELAVHLVEEAKAMEKKLTQSLRIATDERYKRMDHYRSKSNNMEHFERLMQRYERPGLSSTRSGNFPGSAAQDEGNQIDSVVELDGQSAPGERVKPDKNVVGIENRAQWQASFDKNVRRLFVDFQLSDVPSCRLNHLDRMHTWFVEHGAKQVRKVQEGPSYLMADRKSDMPPGSTRNIPIKQFDRPLTTGFTGRKTPDSPRLERPLTTR